LGIDQAQEGMRVVQGRVQFAKEHIDRLFQSAKAMYMDLGLTKRELLDLIHQTIDKNNMQQANDIHIRLVVSRGTKSTPYQNPSVNIGLPLIVIIPEYKAVDPSVKTKGLKLITSHIRRGQPDVKDEMWNHISKATDIQLDPHGFVKTCNSTNFFIVRGGEVWAPTRAYQMQGITRAKTIDICRANGIPVFEQDFTLTETYGADEAFCTGTFPSHIPVREIDGRVVGTGSMGPVTKRLNELYKQAVEKDVRRQRSEILAKL
jgi:branched-chain amino acid aminotransferase